MKVREIAVTYRKKSAGTPTVVSSEVASKVFRQSWERDMQFRERFKVMYLDSANQCLGIYEAGSGSATGVVVDNRQILAIALKVNAVSLIIAHNHPSGRLVASQQDIKVTENLLKGCDYLNIQLLDHLIITTDGYLSFADESLI